MISFSLYQPSTGEKEDSGALIHYGIDRAKPDNKPLHDIDDGDGRQKVASFSRIFSQVLMKPAENILLS
jgi:hypothetical protein